MARKVIGYREMVWTCPACGTKNPGSERTCKSCGGAMPADLSFEQRTDGEILKDEKKMAEAGSGPDIYCAYCGNRNSAGAKVCSNCGADLSEGTARKSGQQYTVQQSAGEKKATILCPNCGTENPASNEKCSACGNSLLSSQNAVERTIPQSASSSLENSGAASGNKKTRGKNGKCCLIFVVLAIILFALYAFGSQGNMFGGSNGSGLFDQPTESIFSDQDSNTISDNTNSESDSPLTATVTGHYWETSVEVLGPVESTKSDWLKNIPSDVETENCKEKLSYTSDEEVDGSKEVCGEPYSLDMGNGYEQIVQDCEYEVYEQYCDYVVTSIGVIDTKTASGSDMNPTVPNVDTRKGYTAGDQEATFSVTLRDENGKNYTINPPTLSKFRSYTVGDVYEIKTNWFGRITSMEKK